MTGRVREFVQRLLATIDWRARDREFDDELASHLEAATADYLQQGLSYEEASRRARIDLGGVTLAREHHREARALALVDTLSRDIQYAFRTLRRAPLASLTVVATVALGLGLVAVVFTIYNLLLLRADAVRGPDQLFAVTLQRWTEPGTDEDLPLARSDYEAMRAETSVFTEIVARREPGGPAYLEGRFARSVFVSGNFFQALGVQAALGRSLLPDDDDRFVPRPVIVLSHAGWDKLFRRDPGVIGRRVVINGAPYEIVGVMPEGFRGLGITPPDYWAPLAMTSPPGSLSAGPEQPRVEVIGRLTSGLSRDAAAAALSAWASARVESRTAPEHPIKVGLTPRRGTLPHEGFDLLFAPLFFAFGLILLIGCANVANLLLARGVSRQREIGIRLSLGASRARIIRQLLTESLMLSLAAAACSVLVARLFLDGTLYAVITTLPPEMAQFMSIFNLSAPTTDWRVGVFLVFGAIVSTAFFGLVPALQATRVDLVPTMRGEVIRGARPRHARHALIAVQVGASALLLICAGIFLRGGAAAARREPGVRTSDTLKVSIGNGPRRAALIQALMADLSVAKIAASSRKTRGTMSPSVPGRAAGLSVLPVNQESVSSDYFEVLGIDLVDGRGFRATERSLEAGVVIVSENTARQFWPKGGVVGQLVRLETPPSASAEARPMPSGPFTVVGVVRDPAGAPASEPDTVRSVYLPTAVEGPDHALVLRVRGDPEQVRQALLERLARIDPAPIMILTFKAMTRMQTYLLEMGFWIAVVLGGLALALTLSGVFSVLSYVVEQQTKEIGVRMALGAGTHNVVRLILFQSVRPVGLGLAAGGGLAVAVAIVLMATPVAAEISGDINVFDPAAYAASLLVIVTSCALAVAVPALRAARIDPIATLRKD